ncbi:MAG: phage tail tape measure protein [Bacteroidales bacterium]|jgi:TP901 family phage tail tape measure protein|nr:phage tail tape measure protein [Bacteroidales bacterium]
MADNSINFTFTIGGNAIPVCVDLGNAVEVVTQKATDAMSIFDKIGKNAFHFTAVTDAVSKLSTSIQSAIQPGISFDHSLRELSAIAQVTGSDLEEIGNKARNLAKTFGGDATDYVESFKDVIGSLGDTFSDSTALDMMGENIATLSKLMGGDAKAAANALTTAMLQYGVDLSNPIAASAEAARMMNVMQAAANVGGSEVADTAEALRQSGLLAKQSGVGFEELNASLEALAKGKIVAGEAGTAMRNILLSMSTLGSSSKEVTEGLKKYGVDVALVADPTAKFTDRLRELQKIQNDPGLMESVFMKANIAAGQTILNNIDTIDEWTVAVTGTNAAVEGAAIVMESFQERQERIQAKFNDLKISFFEATGDLGLWASTIAQSLVPMAQMLPLFSGVGSGLLHVAKYGKDAYTALGMYNGYLSIGKVENLGFGKNVLQAATALVRFATVGVVNGLKGIGAWILSLVTGGAASVKFATISSGAFGTFAATARTACTAVSTAISSIPIIGWIALAITAIGTLGVYLYTKCDGFRAFVQGTWEAIKAIFSSESMSDAFQRGYAESMKKSAEARKKLEEDEKAKDGTADIDKMIADLQTEMDAEKKKQGGGGTTINNTLESTATTAAGDKKIRNVNITIHKLVENFTVSTTTLNQSLDKIEEIITNTVINALNDVNLE